MNKIFLILMIILPCLVVGQKRYNNPSAVELILAKAGKNRGELEKAINYYVSQNNPLKLKAVYFLISNMDIHYSANYYWADKLGRAIPFNESDYKDFESAVAAFEIIKKKNPGIHPQPVLYQDIATIKGQYLIDNVESAFLAWKNSSAKSISFKDFCEYILPYRASIEPLQNWRRIYNKKYQWITDTAKYKGTTAALSYVSRDFSSWFIGTYGIEERKEPLPRLGALQMLFRKRGMCEDIADLTVFTLRSQGIPVSLDIVPYWATSTGRHFLNCVFDDKMKPIPMDVSGHTGLTKMAGREPSKVLRITYAKQPNVIASFEKVTNIPNGFMKTKNYVDVTSQYWKTTDIKCSLTGQDKTAKTAYACVFNGLNWHPTWWGRIHNNIVVFNSMAKGAVFLPAYCINGKIKSAGPPVAEGYDHEQVLNPNLANRRNIFITEQYRYLKFQSGKKYKLYYWNDKWRLVSSTIANINANKLLFTNVPSNALLLLVPEYSKGLERPFTVSTDGKRQWW